MTRDEVIEVLLKNRVHQDMAVQYADVYLEYMKSTENIAEYGLIVQHPRTGNPIENPYLRIRDRAEKKLARMRNIKADGLW